MKLYVLDLGYIETATEVMLPGVNDGGRFKFPVQGYLLDTDEGYVLVDTGMSDGHVDDHLLTWRGTELEDAIVPEMAPSDALATRLRELGVDPSEIRYVINSHLHFDHAGNNHLFPEATVIAQKSHVEYARSLPHLFHPRFWDGEETKFRLVDGSVEVLPGIRVVVSNGHAIGHQSVYVSLDNDPDMLLCGDAIQNHETLELDNWGGHSDPEAARVGGRELEELAASSDALLVFSHDADQSATLRKAPEFYS